MSDWFDTRDRLDEPRRLNAAHGFLPKSKPLDDTTRSYLGSNVAQDAVKKASSSPLFDKEVNLNGLPYSSTVVSGREICRQFLIRADLVRDREQFIDDETFLMHGDTATCHEMLMKTDFGFVHQVLTFTRRHEGATDTPMAQAYNSYLPAHLVRLQRYGHFYLSDAERDEHQERPG